MSARGRNYRTDPMLRPVPKRPNSDDDWTTTPDLCEAVTRFVLPELGSGKVLEPAPGAGALADAMRAAGREVVTTDTDFMVTAVPAGVDFLVTNWPFNKLPILMERSLMLLNAGNLQGATLLFRSDHIHAESRDPPHIRLASLNRASAFHFCAWRPRWIVPSEGNGRHGAVWVTWLRPGVSGPRGIFWLRRRNGRVEMAT
jgi:hypothetical protein